MAGPEDETKPRVFLSYTRDPESDEIRRRLERALADAGLEFWRGVPPGEEAQAARDRYLDRADGAVAIVSPLALEAEWMRAEADLLRRRASSDRQFALAALATPDVGAEALARWGESAVPADADVDAQIADVLQRLAPLLDGGSSARSESSGGLSRIVGGAVHDGAVSAVALTTLNGRACAVTGDAVGTLRVIDLIDDSVRLELQGLHSGFVSAIAVAPVDAASRAVSVGYDGQLFAVDLVEARVVRAQHPHEGPIGGVALLHGPDGLMAITGGRDGTVRLTALHGDDREPTIITSHDDAVRAVAIAGRDGIIVTGGDDRRLRVTDLDAPGTPATTLRDHGGPVAAVAVTHVGGVPIAASAGDEGSLRFWDVGEGAAEPLSEPLRAHDEGVMALSAAAFADRAIVVSAGYDGTLRIWDARTRDAIGEPLRGHDGPVGAVAIGVSEGRPVILSGGSDTSVRLWSVPGLEDVATEGSADESHDRVEWVSDARADVDLLQRRPLAAAIATRLRRLRDDEPGRSFLIHVDGRWGSGKSTLLDLLRKELADDDWLVVDFDAWRQMRVGPPWWALLASLRHAVRRDLGSLAATRLRIAESAQRARRGGALYVLVVAALLALVLAIALLLGAGLDVGATGRLVSSIVAITAGIGVLYAAMSAVGRFLLWDSAAGARVFELSHRDPMESVADHFAWLIARAGRPVVFFVDDLDRCADEYVVDLLDSVQTLIRDAPDRIAGEPDAARACYVVVAADGRWIRTSYEHAHGEFAGAVGEPGRPLGYLFLDKIFQLTVPVPSISPQRQTAYLQALLRVGHDGPREERLDVQVRDVTQRVEDSKSEAEALEAFDEAAPEVRAAVAGAVVGKLAQPQIEEATQHRLERFAGLLETNPRAMKLVLNAYGMARALQVIEDNVVSGDALALWTILRVRWPALADHVRAHPESIEALAAGQAPDGAPAELATLFCAPEVRRVVDCADGGPLDAATIRACCGIPEKPPLTGPRRAGRP